MARPEPAVGGTLRVESGGAIRDTSFAIAARSINDRDRLSAQHSPVAVPAGRLSVETILWRREGGHVDAQKLKEIQSPLKARYRQEPAAAMITLEAEGRLGREEVSCSVATGRAMVEAGLHPATGGDGSFACSGDMLLQALVACAGVTLRSVAINRGLEVDGLVRAEGDLDFRGTLGVDRNASVGFTAIRLLFELTSSASQDELNALVETTERYCVVLQTLTRSPEIKVSSTAR
jgi:uncharacterized OsmC-like protein